MANAPKSKPATVDEKIKAGQEAEIERQQIVTEAVALANEKELPELGGTPENPGLGA